MIKKTERSIVLILGRDPSRTAADGAVVFNAECVEDGTGIVFLLIGVVVVAQMGKFVGER